MTKELLQRALGALHRVESVQNSSVRDFEFAVDALRSALAAPQPEPVALESVHLTRDTQGMCVVRVNGRVAIRDNGDIIDHMATLGWFAAPPAAPAPAVREPLTDREIQSHWERACQSEIESTTRELVRAFARAIEQAHGIGGGGK